MKSSSQRQFLSLALLGSQISAARFGIAHETPNAVEVAKPPAEVRDASLATPRADKLEEQVEVTGNVYCRTTDEGAERPLSRLRVYLKQRPSSVAESGAGNGKFRLRVPASELVDRDVSIVYANGALVLAEDQRHVVQDDLTWVGGHLTLRLGPRIFTVPNCVDLDNAGLREAVRLTIERMSHRAAVMHSELVRAHAAGNPDTSACLNEALSRIGAHLRFAESRVPRFMDAIGDDSVRANREVTAIKIADERVAELVEEADHCMERAVRPTEESVQYAPDRTVTPSELAQIADWDSPQPAPPWGSNRLRDARVPTDDDWHFYPGLGFETGYDSNFLQRNQELKGGSVPAGWQFRPSAHLSFRRYDPTTANASPASMQSGPVQSGYATLTGVLLTSTQAGGQSLGLFSDVAVDAEFRNRFGDDGPLGGVLEAKFHRLVEPTIEPENAVTFGNNIIGLGAEALVRPGSGRFEAGLGYRLGLEYHDAIVQQPYDRVRHAIRIRERWLFLPETAVVQDTEIASLTYVGNQMALNDSEQIRFRLGLAGVLFQRFAVEALVGRAEGYYTADHGKTANFMGPTGHAKLEWFLGPISQRSYAQQALVRPSFALAYDHDFRDNVFSDYYRFDRGQAGLTLAIDDRWLINLHAGIARYAYPQSRFYDPASGNRTVYHRFDETRVDLAGAVEYRVLPQLRFTLSYRYDQNLSSGKIPFDPSYPTTPIPIDYHRSRLYAGIIWSY